MKRTLPTMLLAAIASLVMGQGKVGSGTHRSSPYQTYDIKSLPPMSLTEAYARAASHIGEATNRFYCVTATCLESTNAGFTGWVFSFANTNGQRGTVDVYFDGEVVTAAKSGEVLIGK